MYLYILLLVCTAAAYDDVDEKFSYDDVAKDKVELKKHIDCFMDRGPCSDTALHYKGHILDAVLNACKNCSPHHKHNAHMFIRAMINEYPEDYKLFKQMYDAEGSHWKAMEDEVNKF